MGIQKEALAKSRMQRSKQFYSDAGLLHKSSGSPAGVIVLAYRAMIAAAQGLLALEGYDPHNDRATIALFLTRFVSNGKASRDLFRTLRTAMDIHTKVIFRGFADVSPPEAGALLSNTALLLEEVRKIFINETEKTSFH